MIYNLYIKSHCEAPDYEDETSAGSLEEAADIFLKRINKNEGDWSKEMLMKYIEADEDHVDPEEQMAKAEHIRDGMREDGITWNKDNYPPHNNLDKFNSDNNL